MRTYILLTSAQKALFYSGHTVMFFEHTRIYQEGLSKNTIFFKKSYSVCRTHLINSSNRYEFSQKPLFSLRTLIFRYLLFSHGADINFPRAFIFSLNRYSFSRKSYLVFKHILFSSNRWSFSKKVSTPPRRAEQFF